MNHKLPEAFYHHGIMGYFKRDQVKGEADSTSGRLVINVMRYCGLLI